MIFLLYLYDILEIDGSKICVDSYENVFVMCAFSNTLKTEMSDMYCVFTVMKTECQCLPMLLHGYLFGF